MFDTALEGLNGRKDRKRRLYTPILVGAGLHAAAVLCILGAGVWTVDDSIVPPETIVFPGAVHVQLDDGGHPSTHQDVRKGPAVRGRERLAAIRFQDTTPITTRHDDPATDTSGNDSAGNTDDTRVGTGGDPRGRPGDIGEKSGEIPLSGDEPVRIVGGDVHAPVLLVREEPAYPETARRIGAAGTVVLEAVISASGDVENVRVLKSAHPLLDAAAVRAVGAWRYRPATLGGRPVRVFLTVTVNFALR